MTDDLALIVIIVAMYRYDRSTSWGRSGIARH